MDEARARTEVGFRKEERATGCDVDPHSGHALAAHGRARYSNRIGSDPASGRALMVPSALAAAGHEAGRLRGFTMFINFILPLLL
jgi:hypothetical protein